MLAGLSLGILLYKPKVDSQSMSFSVSSSSSSSFLFLLMIEDRKHYLWRVKKNSLFFLDELWKNSDPQEDVWLQEGVAIPETQISIPLKI